MWNPLSAIADIQRTVRTINTKVDHMSDQVPVRIPADAQPGAVVELHRDADGTMAAQVRIPAPEAED